MKRLRVTRLLNTRIGGAYRTFKKGPVRLPLEEIYVEDEPVFGEVISGNGTWYKLGNYYYWSGGVNEVLPVSVVTTGTTPVVVHTEPAVTLPINMRSYINERFVDNVLRSPIDYNELLNVPEDIKRTRGMGVKIAIIDAAIYNNIEFAYPVERIQNITPVSNHGSFVAGIIAGYKNILGIANQAQLIELPTHGSGGHREPFLVQACADFLLSREELMVVNISQSLPADLGHLFTNIKNKIIVASAGKGATLLSRVEIPADQPNIIAIGVIKKSEQSTIPSPELHEKLDFVFGDHLYVSYSTSDHEFVIEPGDSFACAVTSAIIALLISSGRINKETPLSSILDQLRSLSKPYSQPSQFDYLNLINRNI